MPLSKGRPSWHLETMTTTGYRPPSADPGASHYQVADLERRVNALETKAEKDADPGPMGCALLLAAAVGWGIDLWHGHPILRAFFRPWFGE